MTFESPPHRARENQLITFALFAYNQEEVIRDAIKGILSQTYTPLEIILSDDCSNDRTFEIMQEMAREYIGPHHVRLNRNERNLGVGSHINKVMSMTKSELIVVAAGDDISTSDRVETLTNDWVSNGCVADSLHSSEIRMTENGDPMAERKPADPNAASPSEVIYSSNPVIGATHAWTKRVFDRFGPLLPDLVIEDRAIRFRASLLGGAQYIDTPLVYHRIGGVSNRPTPLLKIFSRELSLYRQHESDLLKAEYSNAKLLMTIRRKIAIDELIVSILSPRLDIRSSKVSPRTLALYPIALTIILKYWAILSMSSLSTRANAFKPSI